MLGPRAHKLIRDSLNPLRTMAAGAMYFSTETVHWYLVMTPGPSHNLRKAVKGCPKNMYFFSIGQKGKLQVGNLVGLKSKHEKNILFL